MTFVMTRVYDAPGTPMNTTKPKHMAWLDLFPAGAPRPKRDEVPTREEAPMQPRAVQPCTEAVTLVAA